MNGEQIAIFGASGFGREVAWLAEACGLQVVCFIDDNQKKQGKIVNDIPVMGIEQAAENFSGAAVVAGAGNPAIREQMMVRATEAGFESRIIMHPAVEMSSRVKTGQGVVICAGSILTTDIELGNHVQINLNCTIGHDVVMGDFTTLAPGVNVSGWVHFGRRVYVGTGAVFVNGTEDNPIFIGDDVVIGAGACITKSISSGVWGGCRPSPCTVADENAQDRGRFEDWQYPVIEDGKLTRYNWMVQHKEHLDLGYKTDIGAFTYINAKYGVTIEDFVQVGSHCAIYSVSTIDDKSGPVKLKKNARIGSHSTIMPGVTIGENAVVGAHSFVNRDVADGAVVAGVPAGTVVSGR